MTKVALIVGPESTGTRLFTRILSEHPLTLGTTSQGHEDILDQAWAKLEAGDMDMAQSYLPDLEGVEYLVTRRTVPHGRPFIQAEPTDLPNLQEFYLFCLKMKLDLVVLITSRSTAANLASWTLARASPGGDLQVAKQMYQKAYQLISLLLFYFADLGEIPFFFLSLEALLLDQQSYIQSIFQLLGLPPHHVEVDYDVEVNRKRYEWYTEQGEAGRLV